MTKLLFAPQAKDDLMEIRTYITHESGDSVVAQKQAEMIFQKLRLLQEQPRMGTPLTAIIGLISDYRYIVCGSYYAFYKYNDETVFIIRILHCSRDYMRVLFGITDSQTDIEE